MTFTEVVGRCLSNYATFQGRSARSEFWYYFLFSFLILIAAIALDNMVRTTFVEGALFGWIYLLCVLGNFLPAISVIVRRLHDTNHSGWWYWFFFVPVIGPIVLLVWFCTAGSRGDNQFGPDPLADECLPRLSAAGQYTSARPLDVAAQLERLTSLHSSGALSDAEFRELKSRLINS